VRLAAPAIPEERKPIMTPESTEDKSIRPDAAAESTVPCSPTPVDQSPTILNANEEREAFKALLDFINGNKEGGTVVEHMTIDEFMADLE
jgi:hypothetical protein